MLSAATISVFGVWYRVPVTHSAIIWGISVFVLLLARAIYGGLSHSIERFGMVHVHGAAFAAI
jgi:hypothetical protein